MISKKLQDDIAALSPEDMPRLLLYVANLQHRMECNRARQNRAISAVRVGPLMSVNAVTHEGADVLQKILEEFQSRFGGTIRQG